MADNIGVRLYWADGRVEPLPDGVDAEATEIQIQDVDGYHEFRDIGRMDADGFQIFRQVLRA